MSTTGYDEAAAWLKEHAPDWRIAHSVSTLRPGSALGAPTMRHYEVTLGHDDNNYSWGRGILLVGDGPSLLNAVINAIGLLHDD